ncbi:MAG TPA: non-ribosomal peptide synthetase [Methylomirabilota bacterium]|nr:non-ribosomal peptide synthetase [Methylomirabilota bacterium]
MPRPRLNAPHHAALFGAADQFVEFRREETEQSIARRFEQQVDKHPDHIAVKTRQSAFTYDALNKAANLVARALAQENGPRERPVALLFGHSAQMVVGMMGVWKAGQIAVPIDCRHPRGRIVSILEDSGAHAIVTDRENIQVARELARGHLQLIESDAIGNSHSTENLNLPVPPDALARIIYTSGSTGNPKGVVHNHRSILHNVLRFTNQPRVTCMDRLLLLSNYGHTAGITAILRALLNGAAVFPFDVREEGMVSLADWLSQEGITIYHSVPSAFRAFTGALHRDERFPTIRLVQLDGEPVSVRDIERYKTHFSDQCLLLNNFGGTETGSCCHLYVDKQTQIAETLVPVGYAVEDTEVLLLDEAGEEVPSGHIGEIAVKSRYLALGYWNRPDLTREKFVPDPGGGEQWIYRTGDLGRFLPDGCLVHLGRRDSQVKIRGYRIELTEIELALLGHPRVKESAVAALDYDGDRRLVAYVVPEDGPVPASDELRNLLQKKLPHHMVPWAFVTLESLPLLPTGKVDRQALPAPDPARPELSEAFVGPITALEKVIAGLWSELLRIEQIGVHDNFFDLGGHSLLATQVISRIREAFGVELPLRCLFEQPTVGALAGWLLRDPQMRGRIERTAELMLRLCRLSDDEVERLLAETSTEPRP